MMCNIRRGIVQWQIPNFLSDGNSNVGEGHDVQHSPWHCSMANT